MISRSVRVYNMFRRSLSIYHISRYSRNVKYDIKYKRTSFVILQDGEYREQQFLHKAFNLDNLRRFFKYLINVGDLYHYSIRINKLNDGLL